MEAVDDEGLYGNVGLAETRREEVALVDGILAGCDDDHEGGRGLGEQFEHPLGPVADPGFHSLEGPQEGHGVEDRFRSNDLGGRFERRLGRQRLRPAGRRGWA